MNGKREGWLPSFLQVDAGVRGTLSFPEKPLLALVMNPLLGKQAVSPSACTRISRALAVTKGNAPPPLPVSRDLPHRVESSTTFFRYVLPLSLLYRDGAPIFFFF